MSIKAKDIKGIYKGLISQCFNQSNKVFFLLCLTLDISKTRQKNAKKGKKRLFMAQNPINPIGEVGFSRGGEG